MEHSHEYFELDVFKESVPNDERLKYCNTFFDTKTFERGLSRLNIRFYETNIVNYYLNTVSPRETLIFTNEKLMLLSKKDLTGHYIFTPSKKRVQITNIPNNFFILDRNTNFLYGLKNKNNKVTFNLIEGTSSFKQNNPIKLTRINKDLRQKINKYLNTILDEAKTKKLLSLIPLIKDMPEPKYLSSEEIIILKKDIINRVINEKPIDEKYLPYLAYIADNNTDYLSSYSHMLYVNNIIESIKYLRSYREFSEKVDYLIMEKK